MPSPLKSPTAREKGVAPTGSGLPVAEVNPPAAIAQKYCDVVAKVIGRCQILKAIAVEVPCHHGERSGPRRKRTSST